MTEGKGRVVFWLLGGLSEGAAHTYQAVGIGGTEFLHKKEELWANGA